MLTTIILISLKIILELTGFKILTYPVEAFAEVIETDVETPQAKPRTPGATCILRAVRSGYLVLSNADLLWADTIPSLSIHSTLTKEVSLWPARYNLANFVIYLFEFVCRCVLVSSTLGEVLCFLHFVARW